MRVRRSTLVLLGFTVCAIVGVGFSRVAEVQYHHWAMEQALTADAADWIGSPRFHRRRLVQLGAYFEAEYDLQLPR